MAALLIPAPVNRRLALVTALALVFSFQFAGQRYLLSHLKVKIDDLARYADNLLDPQYQAVDSPEIEQDRLPEPLLAAIGKGSVDVIPWEIATVYANNLAYAPRPVIQSYSAYDGYLDAKNAAKYASDSGPDFVLYSPGDIDDRHLFFTESQTKLALLANYEIASRSDKLLLLRRLPTSLPITEVKTVSGQTTLGEVLSIENTAQLQMMTANIEYSLLGKLVRFLYQPAKLKVRIEFPNGETRDYRAIPTILSGGVLINRFANSLDHAEDFFGTHGAGRTQNGQFVVRNRSAMGVQKRLLVPDPLHGRGDGARSAMIAKAIVLIVFLGICALVATACSGNSALSVYLEANRDRLSVAASAQNRPIPFVVAPGTPAKAIAQDLQAAGLINDALLFEAYVRVQGLSSKLEAGTHTLSPDMTIPEIADVLQNALAPSLTVAVRPGWRLEQTADVLNKTAQTAETLIDRRPQPPI